MTRAHLWLLAFGAVAFEALRLGYLALVLVDVADDAPPAILALPESKT